MLDLILIVLVFLLSTIYLGQCWNSKKFPPGPWGLPLLGYAPFLGRNPSLTYHNLSKKYGPIFSVQIGTRNWVVLNTREVIYEAFSKQGKLTSNRPRNAILEVLTNGLAVSFNDGPVWKSQRDFMMKILKRFGKHSMEERTVEEIEYLCKALDEKQGEAFECQSIIAKSVANIVCSVLTGKRYSYRDKKLDKMISSLIHSVSGERKSDDFWLLMAAPFLRHLPCFRKCYKKLLDGFNHVKNEISLMVEEHTESLDENHPRDFVDEFLLEIEKGRDPSFTNLQLKISIQDCLVAGTETTSNTLRWCVLALVLYPKHQEQISQEISNIVGSSGRISLKNQDDMPFTRAFLQEVWRYCPAVPQALPHLTSSDIILHGHKIPAKTPIVANLWTVHRNPEYFDNPDEFRPERFLDEKGQFLPCDHIIPFSLGSRRCIGEQLARIELFLFLTILVQKFELLPGDAKTLPPLENGVLAITYMPREFNVEFCKR